MAQVLKDWEKAALQAEELYAREIRAKVEPEHNGKYLVIEVNSGTYETDTDDIALMKRTRAKYPKGVFHMMRVGSPALTRI